MVCFKPYIRDRNSDWPPECVGSLYSWWGLLFSVEFCYIWIVPPTLSTMQLKMFWIILSTLIFSSIVLQENKRKLGSTGNKRSRLPFKITAAMLYLHIFILLEYLPSSAKAWTLIISIMNTVKRGAVSNYENNLYAYWSTMALKFTSNSLFYHYKYCYYAGLVSEHVVGVLKLALIILVITNYYSDNSRGGIGCNLQQHFHSNCKIIKTKLK